MPTPTLEPHTPSHTYAERCTILKCTSMRDRRKLESNPQSVCKISALLIEPQWPITGTSAHTTLHRYDPLDDGWTDGQTWMGRNHQHLVPVHLNSYIEYRCLYSCVFTYLINVLTSTELTHTVLLKSLHTQAEYWFQWLLLLFNAT